MNNVIEELSKVIDCKNGKGYFHNINALLIKIGFTDKEKVVIEKFLFDPSRVNANEALNVTPKSYALIKNYMTEEEVISEMVNVIENRKYDFSYVKTLITNPELRDISNKLKQTSVGIKIENVIKRCEMDKKLRKERDGYDVYNVGQQNNLNSGCFLNIPSEIGEELPFN